MTDTVLSVGRDGPVATVTLTRGKVNAIDVEVLDELATTLGTLERDADVGAVVITGAGRAFSAGVDLRRVVDSGPSYVEHLVTGLRRTLEVLFCFPKPTVAAVDGAAVAGGCILACACDRRLMADGARIGASELAVGVPFPWPRSRSCAMPVGHAPKTSCCAPAPRRTGGVDRRHGPRGLPGRRRARAGPGSGGRARRPRPACLRSGQGATTPTRAATHAQRRRRCRPVGHGRVGRAAHPARLRAQLDRLAAGR